MKKKHKPSNQAPRWFCSSLQCVWKGFPLFPPGISQEASEHTDHVQTCLALPELQLASKPSFKTNPQTFVKLPLFSLRWNMSSPSTTSECQISQSLAPPRAEASFWAKVNKPWAECWNKRGAGYQHSAFYGIRYPSHERKDRYSKFWKRVSKTFLKAPPPAFTSNEIYQPISE